MLPQPIVATDNSTLGGSRGINPNELGHEWTPDFPVMSEWIDYPAQTPAVGFLHAHHRLGSCRECPRENRIWIPHRRRLAEIRQPLPDPPHDTPRSPRMQLCRIQRLAPHSAPTA